MERKSQLPLLLSAFALAAACSSSTSRRAPEDGPDADSSTGGKGTGGRATGGAASVEAGVGGSTNTGGKSSGGTAGDGGDAGAGGDASIGGDGGAPGDASSDAGGAGDAGDASTSFGTPTTVSTYGCFVLSGDGGDLMSNGQSAVELSNSPYGASCDSSAWVSDNPDAFAPMTPPTTIALHRSFILDPAVAAGDVTVSTKADDAVEIVLNGHLVGSCTPPEGDPGACQRTCTVSSFPNEYLLRDGQVNKVEIRLLNLQSVPASGGNYGYTAISYSMCVTEPT